MSFQRQLGRFKADVNYPSDADTITLRFQNSCACHRDTVSEVSEDLRILMRMVVCSSFLESALSLSTVVIVSLYVQQTIRTCIFQRDFASRSVSSMYACI